MIYLKVFCSYLFRGLICLLESLVRAELVMLRITGVFFLLNIFHQSKTFVDCNTKCSLSTTDLPHPNIHTSDYLDLILFINIFCKFLQVFFGPWIPGLLINYLNRCFKHILNMDSRNISLYLKGIQIIKNDGYLYVTNDFKIRHQYQTSLQQ